MLTAYNRMSTAVVTPVLTWTRGRIGFLVSVLKQLKF